MSLVIKMSQPDSVLKLPGHDGLLSQAFRRYLSNQRYCNVLLSAEGKVLRCHQEILSASSQFFSALFENIDKNMQPVVFLKDIQMTDLRILIDFIYSGEVSVPQEKVQTVIDVGKSLKISGLCDSAESTKTPKESTTKQQLNTSYDSHERDSTVPVSIDYRFAKKSSPKTTKESDLMTRGSLSDVRTEQSDVNLFMTSNLSNNSEMRKSCAKPLYSTSTATPPSPATTSGSERHRSAQRFGDENAGKFSNSCGMNGNEISQSINTFAQDLAPVSTVLSPVTCSVSSNSHQSSSVLHDAQRKSMTSVTTCHAMSVTNSTKTINQIHHHHPHLDQKKYETLSGDKNEKSYEPSNAMNNTSSNNEKVYEDMRSAADNKKYEATLVSPEDKTYETLQTESGEKKYVTLKTRKEKDFESRQSQAASTSSSTSSSTPSAASSCNENLKEARDMEALQQGSNASSKCSLQPKPKKRRIYESAAPVYDNRQIFAADLLQTQLDYAGGEDVDDCDAFAQDSVLDLNIASGIEDCGPFKKIWSETYLCYNLGKEIICLLCFCRFTQFKKYNLNRHMEKKHNSYFQLSMQTKKRCLDEFVRRYEELVTSSVLSAVPGQGNQTMVFDILRLKNVDWSELLGEEYPMIFNDHHSREDMDTEVQDQQHRQEAFSPPQHLINPILDC